MSDFWYHPLKNSYTFPEMDELNDSNIQQLNCYQPKLVPLLWIPLAL